MTVIVGCPPEVSSTAAVHLAAMLARSARARLVVCAIVPVLPRQGTEPESVPPARIDARATLESAQASMPADVEASYVVREARSISAAMLELVAEYDADLIVVGSSAAGVFGHLALGSVTSRLLHAVQVPVALAPKEFRMPDQRAVERVTAAYNGSVDQDWAVLAAAALAARLDATLRLAAFAVRIPPPYTTRLGTEGDAPVADEWVSEIEQAATVTQRRVAELPTTPRTVELSIGFGRTLTESLEDVGWETTDILTIGSNRIGPLSRILLGARGAKIVRHSPVPVIVFPH
ncbi:universal stress protein [Nocardia sp. NPDC049149]|uniref:universal stress protein n=1 Tax=Nocardia sp. NPDC049149 TaxID=3364315 RepID=UPI0037242EAF